MFPIRDHNPSGRTPYVTLGLIAINAVVFLLYYPFLDDWNLARFYATWGLVPARLGAGQGYETLITHMFLHGGWMHIIGNMLFLWIFGDNMEDAMGHVPFALFYLASGLAAAGLQVAADPGSMAPMVGASGAVAGVMGGYLLLFPKARVDVFIFLGIFFYIFSMRAWIVLLFWVGMQIASGVIVMGEEGGVAYWAHVGGFIGGLVLTLPVWLRRGAGGYWRATDGRPPHPQAQYPLHRSRIPRVPRR